MIATIASPTTEAAGTAQTSLRSKAASNGSLVRTSTEGSARRSVAIGFIAARHTTGIPLVTPPSRPPARLLGRVKARAAAS